MWIAHILDSSIIHNNTSLLTIPASVISFQKSPLWTCGLYLPCVDLRGLTVQFKVIMGILVSLLLILRSVIVGTTLQVRVCAQSLFGNQLFWVRDTFFLVASCQNFRRRGNQKVATWRVVVAFKKGWNELMF